MSAGTETRSRRSLLVGMLGGVAASTALAPDRAEAGSGPPPVKLGQSNSASSLTSISSSTTAFKGNSTGATGLLGQTSSGSGFGVNGINTGSSGNRIGVRGSAATNGIGVYGIAPRGVFGDASAPNGTGVVAQNSKTTGSGAGLRAFAFAPQADAVSAENSADGGSGRAIHATSSTDTTVRVENVAGDPSAVGLVVSSTGSGVESKGRLGLFGQTDTTNTGFSAGVRGVADKPNHRGGSFLNSDATGFALEAEGGVKVAGAAGKATIGAGEDSTTVTPGAPVRTSSIVLATLQSDPGGGETLARVVVGATNFTIHLTGDATTQCTVGWMILN